MSKLAFPWLCIKCEEFGHGKEDRYDSSWGPVCSGCWQWVKERTFEDVTEHY